MSEPEKNPRKRKQKEQDAQDFKDREHKHITQAGVPKDKEKGKKDKGDEKKQQEGATKIKKDVKQKEAADKRDEDEHNIITQPKGCQLQFKDILLAVNICAIVLLIILIGYYVWRVEDYKAEVALLQENVTTMESMIRNNMDMLTTLNTTLTDKIGRLMTSMNNAATKQDVSDMNSTIAQLNTTIQEKCKGH